ncbi:MAG TPA: hypothetical protein VFX61_10050 [Micromonosporaceae bacterium]|nr:hypothetical protein [Micromonosporaceae bacterium]
MTHSTAPRESAAEPPSTILELPAGMLELLGLPSLEGLGNGQVRGQDCVWCGTGQLAVATSVDYGEQMSPLSGAPDSARMRWYPRGCRPCTGRRAYRALLSHSPDCAECCAAAPGCTIGRTLSRLAKGGRW